MRLTLEGGCRCQNLCLIFLASSYRKGKYPYQNEQSDNITDATATAVAIAFSWDHNNFINVIKHGHNIFAPSDKAPMVARI
jgi:hypothetical protein